MQRRLQATSVTPKEVYEAVIADLRHMPYWPWAGSTRSSRTAADYFEKVYGRKNCTFHSDTESFLQARDLLSTSEGSEMLLCAEVLDKLAMTDRFTVLNSAGVEVLVRRLEGLHKSLKLVYARAQLSRKVDELAWCDLVNFDPRNAELEAEVRSERKAYAQEARWASESAAQGAAKPQ